MEVIFPVSWQQEGKNMSWQLYAGDGQRKYLNQQERDAFLAAAARYSNPRIRTLCAVLALTGCRISEALALTADRVDAADKVLIFESLKKRRRGHYRAVPVPTDLINELIWIHGLTTIWKMEGGGRSRRLWPMDRSVAWRHIKAVMADAGIVTGTRTTPRGLRHGFGVAAVSSGVPLNLVQRWLGHAQISTTAIYADVMGPEERTLAARMWQ